MKLVKCSALFLLLSQLLPACGDDAEPSNDAGSTSTGTAGTAGTGAAGKGGTANQDAGGAGGTSGTGGTGGTSGPGGTGGASGTGGAGGIGGTGGSSGSAGSGGGAAGTARDSGANDAVLTDAGAGMPDGAVRDAQNDVREAAAIDAIVDIATVDATNPDAGTPDVGAPDVRTPDAACRQAPVALGGADNFVVLAGSTVTNSGPTSVTGDLGVSPGTAVTGFPPGTITGTQHAGDPTAAQGEADLITAYDDARGRTLCAITIAGNLGGQTLTPGLYKSTSSLEISSGDLTLDAQGDASAVFIFQMASTLTTTSGRQVILSGSAKSTNVFWQVGSSATLGSTSSFQGTVMADQAITLTTGATLNGRALARAAAVTLDSNTIVKPAP